MTKYRRKLGKLVRFSSEHEWLQFRKTVITATDAATILGRNRWKSPVALWSEKLGRHDGYQSGEAAEWGLKLEAIVRSHYAKVTGRKVRGFNGWAMHVHPEHPWMASSPDGEVRDPQLGIGGYEGKTANFFAYQEWVSEPPLPYLIQGQHQLACSGREWVAYACLIGGQRFVHHIVRRNDDFIAQMIEHERKFRQAILDEEMPELDGTDSTANMLGKWYPKEEEGTQIHLSDDFTEVHEERERTLDQIDELAERVSACDNKIKAAMKTDEIAFINTGNIKYTWKTNKAGTRVFRAPRRNKDG